MEKTTDEIAAIFKAAGDSVTLINNETSKASEETEEEWKNRIKRNWRHLEIIKAYPIWTTEDFTDIDAAITKGKAVQA